MKNLIFTLSLLTSTAFAGNGVERETVDFSLAQVLNTDVRARMTAILQERCASAMASASQVIVKDVSVQAESIDQGQTDYIYKARILFAGWEQNETYGAAEIEIKLFDITNPAVDNLRLLKLTSDGVCN